jgi:glucose/arabinose dehydrogenase
MEIAMKIEKQLQADELSFPTSLCFDDNGTAYVAESGLPWDGAKRGGSVYRIEENGEKTLLVEELRHPVNGLCWHKGSMIVSEGGFPGRISRLTPDGIRTTILDNLPGLGNYHTNMVVVGEDDKIYFGQGALTNLGVIGMDAYELGWLGRLPHNCDVPGFPIEMVGQTFETEDPFSDDPNSRKQTGVFSEFGSSHEPGARIEPKVPCTASIMSCDLDGSNLEMVCWGIRNAYGLGFLPDGRLIATDQGSDDRGSRPIGFVPEMVYEIKKGAWYGWPDFIGGVPVTDPQFYPKRRPGPALDFVLSNHHELPTPEKPLLALPINSAATKFDCVPESSSQYPGQLIFALFGDEKPMTAPAGFKVGRNLVRVDPSDWSQHPLPDLDVNRPIDVKYNPKDDSVWIVDFGEFEMNEKGVESKSKTGKVWKVKAADLLISHE